MSITVASLPSRASFICSSSTHRQRRTSRPTSCCGRSARLTARTFTLFLLGGALQAERISATPPPVRTTATEAELQEYDGNYPLAPSFALRVLPPGHYLKRPGRNNDRQKPHECLALSLPFLPGGRVQALPGRAFCDHGSGATNDVIFSLRKDCLGEVDARTSARRGPRDPADQHGSLDVDPVSY